jgi:hypothetical protein
VTTITAKPSRIHGRRRAITTPTGVSRSLAEQARVHRRGKAEKDHNREHVDRLDDRIAQIDSLIAVLSRGF